MTSGDPFEKEYVDERTRTDLASVLDHLNLPPAFVSFVRANQKTIKIATVVLVLLVIAWAGYDSYSSSRMEESSSALYNALELEQDEKTTALQKVISDYRGTAATKWAEVELAHIAVKQEKYSEAVERYEDIRKDTGRNNPLYPLVTYGMANAFEGMKEYSKALQEYQEIKDIKGFRSIAVFGIGRIHEIEGRKDEAITAYEEYLSSLSGEQQNNPDKELLEQRIARLKALM